MNVSRIVLGALALQTLVLASAAHAKAKEATPASLLVEHTIATTAAPADVYRAVAQIDRWWSGKHTFSGSAANLSLEPRAGGCFCEKWADGSVEHGRVIQTQRDRLVRLSSTLGPFLDMAVSGVLTFAIAPAKEPAKGTTLVVTYRVSGDASHNLKALAAPVDQVIGEQATRLGHFVDTGKPD
jgi:uncharacterized protein YndB with AHSA1/START domain